MNPTQAKNQTDAPHHANQSHGAHSANSAHCAPAKIIIQADNLEKTYPQKTSFFKKSIALHAVNGISFSIAQGKTLAIVGESGCGKSTLARMAAMLDTPTQGSLEINNINALSTPSAEKKSLRKQVQFIFQNPYASLNPRKRVGEILESPLEINTKLSRNQRQEKAFQMLAKVGLSPEHYTRYPHMFSGGQRQRIAIARALMLEPDLLVADEPFAALDISVQAQILNLLSDLQKEFALSYLLITHDLSVVRHLAHDVLVMYLGKTMEHGSKKAVLERPLHPYTKALLACTPSIAKTESSHNQSILKGELPSALRLPKGCVFSTRCAFAVERCHIESPPLRPFMERKVACFEAERFVNSELDKPQEA